MPAGWIAGYFSTAQDLEGMLEWSGSALLLSFLVLLLLVGAEILQNFMWLSSQGSDTEVNLGRALPPGNMLQTLFMCFGNEKM